RPLGRSGCVTTSATPHAAATARSAGTANSAVPMNTTRGFTSRSPPLRSPASNSPLARARVVARGQLAAGQRVQVALEELALQVREPVGEQHAVQVVGLVLYGARQEAGDLTLERLAVLVEAAQAQFHGALHVGEDAGHRQAALLRLVLAGLVVEDRVHHREAVVGAILVRHVHHEHALGDADLVRGQADAVVGGHGLVQVGDQRAQRVVELVHVARLHAQHGIAVDADGAHTHPLASGVSTCAIALFANSTLVSSEMRSTARSPSMVTTVAKMPLVVSTLSPFLSPSIRCWSFLRSAFCGRMTMK